MGSGSKKDSHVSKMPDGNMVAAQYTEFRVDILPPPDEIEKYEAIHPGILKIILDSYIAQTEHRMHLEKTVIEGDNKRASIGQIISGALSFFCIVAGSILAFLGKDVVGLSLIIGSIGTLLTAFYAGAILRKIERTQKSKSDQANIKT